MANTKIQKIAIDDGSSAIKVVMDNKEIVFNSVVQKGVAWSDDDELSESTYKITDGHYSVVEYTTDRLDTSSDAYQTSRANRVLVHEALRKSGVKGDVQIGLTIPLAKFFLADGTKNKALINKKIDSIKKQISNETSNIGYNIIDIKVFPECSTGFKYVAKKLNLKGYSICIDVGGYTTDIGVFSGGVMVENVTIANGTIKCIQRISDYICREKKMESIPFKIANEALVSGKYKDLDLTELCEEYIGDVVNAALDEAENMASIDSCENTVFIGGGARFIKQYSELDDDMYISDEPHKDNARGMLARMNGEL